MIAFDIEQIMSIDFFKQRMDMLIEKIKDCPRAANIDEIFIPGEIEYNVQQKRLKEGIPVSRAVLRDLNELGKRVGLDNLSGIWWKFRMVNVLLVDLWVEMINVSLGISWSFWNAKVVAILAKDKFVYKSR